MLRSKNIVVGLVGETRGQKANEFCRDIYIGEGKRAGSRRVGSGVLHG